MHYWSLLKLYLAFMALTVFADLVRFHSHRRKGRTRVRRPVRKRSLPPHLHIRV